MISLCSLENHESLQKMLQNSFGLSLNQIKKYINKKNLSRKVAKSDELSLPIELLNNLRINPNYVGPQIKIILEDDNFLVLSKPEKVHCHPLNYSDQNNILSFLRKENFSKYLKINALNYDRSLIYRLDYETSGVIILANTNELYENLRKEFHKQVKRKTYLCICKGRLKEESLILKQYFKKFGPKGEKQVVYQNAEVDSSLGEMNVHQIAYDDKKDLCLLRVELKTGLRHQIRAGLASIGNSIIGDDLYGDRKEERLYLHAYEYEILINKVKKCYRDPKAKLFDKFFDLNRFL